MIRNSATLFEIYFKPFLEFRRIHLSDIYCTSYATLFTTKRETDILNMKNFCRNLSRKNLTQKFRRQIFQQMFQFHFPDSLEF